MPTLLASVALMCLILPRAQPLTTSIDYELFGLHNSQYAIADNFKKWHHIRHRPSHLRSVYNARHQPHFQLENSEGTSESITPAPNAAATERTTFHLRSHHHNPYHQQHPPKGLEVKSDTLPRHPHQHHHQQHNTIYAPHANNNHHHHKHMQKSSTPAMPVDGETIFIATTTLSNTLGQFDPTSHPSTKATQTISFDETNKSKQSYYHQRTTLHQQKDQQQRPPHNHQSPQPDSHLSDMKHGTSSENAVQLDFHVTSHHDEHFSRHTSESVDKNDMAEQQEQSTKAGSSLENITTATAKSKIERKAADDGDDRTNEYADVEADYYDYSDDEPNREERDSHLARVAADIGYEYDNEDGGESPIRIAHSLKGVHYNHPQHNHEQALRQWHQQRQQHQHKYWDQSEHSRVARDHHHAQGQQYHQNQLAYVARSGDEDYPDDEPYRGSGEQFSSRPGDLTFQKYRELGTMQAVQQSRDLYMQRHKSPSDLATEHINRMKVAARCSRPLPRVFHVSNDTSKTYVPSCTILHRCGEDTGCCRSMGQVCTVKTYEDIPLHFIVIQVNSSNSRRQTEIEILWLRNDTECHCVNRTDLTSTPEFMTRDKRSGLAFRRHTSSALTLSHFEPLDQRNQLDDQSDDSYHDEENYMTPDAPCRCPRHFDLFQEDMGWQMVHQHTGQHARSTNRTNCRCDCVESNSSCQRIKNGEEGFAMDDRKCIADQICNVPTCSTGFYSQQIGRCPRPSKKHKRHNNGFG